MANRQINKMINTSGHQVSVMPQYTAVDANLAAFNPAQAMAGVGQAFDVAKGLADLKLMRQTHEENAKMSAAKNKLLEAEAKQKQIVADALAATTESDTARKNVENKAASDVTAAKAPIDIKAIEQRGFELGTQAALNQGVRDTAIKTQPFLNDATVFGARSSAKTAEAGFNRLPDVIKAEDANALAASAVAQRNVARLPVTEDTKDVAAEIALDSALESQDLLPDQQALIRQNLADNLANAKTDADVKRAQAKASLDGEVAKTANLLAQAENYKAMAAGEGRYSKLDEHAKKMMDAVNRISSAQTQIMKTPVVLPGNKGVGTLVQYLAATREGGAEDGAAKRAGIPFITRADVPRNPDAERYIQDYKMLRDQKAALQASWMKLDPLANEPTNSLTSIPKAAIDILMQRPETAELFDKQFGPGSSAHFLKR
jgi:hypothetical protein